MFWWFTVPLVSNLWWTLPARCCLLSRTTHHQHVLNCPSSIFLSLYIIWCLYWFTWLINYSAISLVTCVNAICNSCCLLSIPERHTFSTCIHHHSPTFIYIYDVMLLEFPIIQPFPKGGRVSRDALLVISYSILACSLHLNTPFLCRIKTRERCLLHFSFLPPNPQRNGTPLFWESTVTLSEVTLIDFVC